MINLSLLPSWQMPFLTLTLMLLPPPVFLAAMRTMASMISGWRRLGGGDEDGEPELTDDFVNGFVIGAAGIWDDVKGKI